MSGNDKKILTLGHVGAGTGRHKPFDRIFSNSKLTNSKEIDNGDDIDALVIWGGADISPSLYGHHVSNMCGADAELSERDRVEAGAVLSAIERGIPIIGVCRGAQLVCAVAGGYLLQHVDNHGVTHRMTTSDGREIKTSSVHHQMMYPYDVEHELLAWSTEKRSLRYITEGDVTDPNMEDKPEAEVVFFPKIKALAIQGHPEFHADPDNDPFVQYCLEQVNNHLLSE